MDSIHIGMTLKKVTTDNPLTALQHLKRPSLKMTETYTWWLISGVQGPVREFLEAVPETRLFILSDSIEILIGKKCSELQKLICESETSEGGVEQHCSSGLSDDFEGENRVT